MIDSMNKSGTVENHPENFIEWGQWDQDLLMDVSVDEAAKILEVTSRNVYEQLNDGRLKYTLKPNARKGERGKRPLVERVKMEPRENSGKEIAIPEISRKTTEIPGTITDPNILQDLALQVAEMSKIITEQQRTIQEKEKLISEKDRLIQEKESAYKVINNELSSVQHALVKREDTELVQVKQQLAAVTEELKKIQERPKGWLDRLLGR